MTALEIGEHSCRFWESLPKDQLKPGGGGEELIAANQCTRDLLREAAVRIK